MPSNRTYKSRRRKGSNDDRAIMVKLIYGHWFSFLATTEGKHEEPEEALVKEYWEYYKSQIFKDYAKEEVWAFNYYEGSLKQEYQKCRNEIRSNADMRAVREGCYYDAHAADRVRVFFRLFLKHTKGQFTGRPFELSVWEWRDIVQPCYGWKQKDGARRFQEIYCEVPKKNGKSAICSGLTVYHTVGDCEFGAEVYAAANDKDQAGIVFNEAKHMVQASPALSTIIDILDSKKEMYHHPTASRFKALSADVPSKEGLNASALIVDELHSHKDERLFSTLRYSGASRRQPLTIIITTAGEERKGPCWNEHEYAEKIISGELENISYLPCIYGLSQEEEDADPDYWKSEECWKKVNPGYGETINPYRMKNDFEKALEMPSTISEFRRYRLNVWGEKSTRWFSSDRWNRCSGDGTIIPLEFAPQKVGLQIPKYLQGRQCYGGLDLASRIDIAALCLDFPLDDGYHAWLEFFWSPREGAYDRQRKDRVPYLDWSNAGYLHLTEGRVTDYDIIRNNIKDIAQLVDLQTIAVDKWNSTQLQTQLQEDGFETIEFGQYYGSMAAPCNDIEALITEGKLIHGNHPVLKWMSGNVVAKINPEGRKRPDKEKSTEKIDGIVAGIMAFDCANRLHEENIYDGELMMI